jgi:hypothetical protein
LRRASLLLAAWDGLHGGIEELAVDFDSCQARLLDEAERLLHFGVQIIRQLLSIVARGRLVHGNFVSLILPELKSAIHQAIERLRLGAVAVLSGPGDFQNEKRKTC